jgi:ATP/maltotriose-dependent transcriptional regulator MalT
VTIGVGDVLLDRGDLEGARKSYQESLALRKQIGEKQAVAETELALARLSAEEKQANDAETVIRKCIEEFHQDQEADDEFAARVALVNGFLAEKKYAEAAREADGAKSLAAKSVNELIRLQFDLVAARVESVSGNVQSSRPQLQSTLQKARSHHLLGLEFETRLALAELGKKTGDRGAAQADLLSLEKAARGKDFGLIAAKASRSAAALE